jgi:hypothetical protein
MTVDPTTKAMTTAVDASDPARFSDWAGPSRRSAGTEMAMTSPRTTASGR